MKAKMFLLVERIKTRFFKTCPKSGRIYGVKKDTSIQKIVFIVVGIASMLWFLFRVIPKPSRATYPCMQATAPIMTAFLLWVGSLFSTIVTFRYAKDYFKKSKYMLAFGFSIIAIVAAFTFFGQNVKQLFASPVTSNVPLGTARGIFPGRVVWVRDPAVALWDGNGNWLTDASTPTSEAEKMVSAALKSVAGTTTDADAWDAIFKNFNTRRNGTATGYQAGEKICIKINQNNTWSHNDMQNAVGGAPQINGSPQLIYSVLNSLINRAGVPQTMITVADPSRFINDAIYIKCHTAFPNVTYIDNSGGDGRTKSTYKANAIPFSIDLGAQDQGIATCFTEANYTINMALLKGHDGQGVTFCGKNWFGATSISADWTKNHHNSFNPTDGNTYLTFVDFMGHKDLGNKCILFLMDGIYACQYLQGKPGPKWNSAPFNGNWPASIFVSQDGVAVDAVSLDFFRNEFTNNQWMENSEKYLLEASQANKPPSGTTYDPERDGTTLTSLGVYEHWNNAIDKKYTRNLGTGFGIELYEQLITPNVAPEITTQPLSVSLPLGLTATFKVTANGQAPITYQWKKDGVNIPNATTATLTLANITTTDIASYTVVVTNTLGFVESEPAKLTIGTNLRLATAPKVQTAPTIDGDLTETSWQMTYPISSVVIGTTTNNAEQKYGVMWDDTYLYVGVKVLDATITTNNPEVYNNDAVELYFDMNNTGGAYDALDRSWIKVVNSTNIWEKIGGAAGVITTTSTVKSATKLITGGYTMEFAIPWTNFGVTPNTANLYGFDVVIDDANGGITRANQSVWTGDMNNWMDLSNIGDLALLPQATTTTKTQSITLVKGWNLISFNVTPADKTIVTVFKDVLLNVTEIKTADAFYRSGQNPIFNSLQEISDGLGYLVNMNAGGTITLSGSEIKTGLPEIRLGWNIIGCPYLTEQPLNSLFTNTNSSVVKNFEGFWMPTLPNGTVPSIQSLMPGKGYFVKK